MQIETNEKTKKKMSRLKKGFLFLLILFILGMSASFFINTYMKVSTSDRMISAEEAVLLDHVDCILILGAGVTENGTPTNMLEDRLSQGIELYELGVSDRILMSGDHGRLDYDEVNVMKQFAMAAGVPSAHIFMDHAGFSTYESIYRARDIFEADRIIIVTQDYHLYRALYIAEKLGLDAYGVASNPRQYHGQNLRDIREVMARIKDFFNCMIQPEPTFLGDAIPVNGDGDMTND